VGNASLLSSFEPKEPVLPDYAEFTVRFIIFALAHSLCATNRAKQLISTAAVGEPRFYRLAYNLASFILFIWVMAAYRTSPVLYFAPGIWSLVLYALQTGVAIILFQCIRQTGAGDFIGTNQISSPRNHPLKLVTNGCYSHVRHPLYFYSTLFLFLNPVMTAQWALLTIYSLIYFIIGGLIEERRLLKTFGTEYTLYQQAVPFMIPSVKPFKR
jgi:protein-S-isoprenylcysteine O-methyltransferase Ste14